VNGSGAYFSIEALLSLFILLAAALLMPGPRAPSMQELHLLQKEHDLLKVWAKKGVPPIEEMANDFELAFPKKSGEISVNGRTVKIGKTGGEKAVSSEMLFFDSGMEKTRVSLRVFNQ
jgi:hypothetical protein